MESNDYQNVFKLYTSVPKINKTYQFEAISCDNEINEETKDKLRD